MAKRRKPAKKQAKRPQPREVLPVNLISITLPAGETLSGPLDATQGTVEYLIAPDDWSPAMLTFQVSFDLGATWHDLENSRGEIRYIDESRPGAAINLFDSSIKNVSVRLRSGMPDDPKPQAADRVFTAVIGP